MITFTYAVINGGAALQIRFDIPKNGKVVHEFATVKNLHEAKRMMYFKNRKYIYTKISHWLHQRRHAIVPYNKSVDYAQKVAALEELIIKLEYFQNSSFWHLCSLIARNADQLKLIAPGEKSQHYKHFQSNILPIINFCIEMKGAEH